MKTQITKNRDLQLSGTHSNIHQIKAKQPTCKKEWIRKYANRIYKSWLHWQGPLGIASDYIEQVKKDLEKIYPNALKRVLIEESYL